MSEEIVEVASNGVVVSLLLSECFDVSLFIGLGKLVVLLEMNLEYNKIYIIVTIEVR